jgi:chromate reductase
MAVIVGLAGSLRQGSYNAALLRSAAAVAPEGVQVGMATLTGIPLYDADIENDTGIPAVVSELKERIAAADGLLLVTPEYNASLPGVFKNAIDWLSRPGKDVPRVFGGKPVGIIGATPGQGGTRLSQAAWLPVLRALGTRVWFGKLLHVSGAGQVFDRDGKLVDEKVKSLLSEYMAGFGHFVQTGK